MAVLALLAGLAIGYVLGHRRPPVAVGTPAPVMAPEAPRAPVVRLVGHRVPYGERKIVHDIGPPKTQAPIRKR